MNLVLTEIIWSIQRKCIVDALEKQDHAHTATKVPTVVIANKE